MKPLLKWPGGKTRELSRLRAKLPASFGRYFEPFVGGGAAFFSLEPERAVVNDVHRELVGLYRGVAGDDPELRAALEEIALVWDEGLTRVAGEALGPICAWYAAEGRGGGAEAPQEILEEAASRLDPVAARPRIVASLADKLRRMRRLEQRHETVFEPDLVHDQVETGLRAGYYYHLRDEAAPGGPAGEVAVFYFLREFCYGSMFRQNKQGRFNIPYGGIAYNRKRMRAKLDRLFDPARRDLLGRTEIRNQDFRELFEDWAPRMAAEDLVFLDPPYDSDFQEYDGRAFGEAEQRALAEVVADLPCGVVGIMKATPLVRELYQQAAKRRKKTRRRTLQLEEYGKTYTYNVRGRNRRDVSHLLMWDVG